MTSGQVLVAALWTLLVYGVAYARGYQAGGGGK